MQAFFQGAGSKQVASEDREYLLHGHADFAHEFLVGQQQVHGQCGVALKEDGVFRVADNAYDAQDLLDFTEEYLNAPALLMDSNDRTADKARRPSRMDRRAASWTKAMTVNGSLNPSLQEERRLRGQEMQPPVERHVHPDARETARVRGAGVEQIQRPWQGNKRKPARAVQRRMGSA